MTLRIRFGKYFLALIISCLLTYPVTAFAGKGDDVIRSVQEKFRAIQSLSVRFDMRQESSEGGISEQEGRVYLGDSGKFRMESPQQTIVSDGATAWTYSPSERQVIIYRADQEDAPLVTPRQILFDFADRYRVEKVEKAEIAGLPADLLIMAPLDPGDPTASVKVWVDRRERFTRRLRIEDLAGNITTFDFEDFIVGKPLPDSTFRFEPPEGAEIIDMR